MPGLPEGAISEVDFHSSGMGATFHPVPVDADTANVGELCEASIQFAAV